MGRLRGCLWLTAGLLVALLAGFVGFMALNRATAMRGAQPGAVAEVDVVVAKQSIAVGDKLTADNLVLKKLPVTAVPEGAVQEIAQAEGKITTVDLYPDEIILSQRLLDPNVADASGRLALLVADDQVLMALPAKDLMSQVGVLKPGDHVDLLFSLDFPTERTTAGGAGGAGAGQEEQATFDLLQNVTISAIVGAQTSGQEQGQTGNPKALLLTLTPQDALALKYVIDADGVLDIVLRAPGAEQPFTTEPVDVDWMINKYRIPTEIGR